ncbi:MAG TPA: hypothetical protein VN345_13425, partial [Blastocatellia bacterium]|nr:hypothetical protein [Blastocatellia bacterium]
MSRRKYSSIGLVAIAVVAIAVVGFAALVVTQKIAPTKPKAATGQAASGAGARAGRGKAAARPAPIRPADPNRAPQAVVDDALYTNQEFFGVSASVARPYSDALGRLDTLLNQYPKDARLHLQASRIAERLSQYDRSAKEMAQYADLEKRSPAALRRLADFDHHRALFADEAKTLQELARAVPIAERSAIYKRAAVVVRSHSLKDFTPADFFRELVAADPTNIQPARDYVEELRLAKRNKEALDLLASFQPKFPSETAYFLKQRAQILEATSGRRAAEDVYSSAFDPNWPRPVAGDYYDLLRRFGRYRIVRRDLQHRVAAGATELDTVARLFSVYSYGGDYEQAGRMLRDLEERRGGKPQGGGTTRSVASQSAWSGRELETAAEMFASIGDYDQASRYLYTLYLTGGLAQGSQQREDALYRLFTVMLDASGTPTRVGTGDLSFYKDIAAVDRHPGFLNGVLSLVLSDSDPASELATEEKAAAGYFNRAFAYRIFTAFEKEYPQSPRLGDMYLGVVNVFAGLNEHRLAIEAGREFRQRFPDSPKYVEVSLRLADSYVALKDRVNERAVLAELLDRLAKATPKGVPLAPVAAKDGDAISPKLENLIDRIEYNIEAYGDAEASTESEASSEDSGESGNETTSEAEASESSTDTAGNTETAHAPSYSSVLERYVSSLAAEDKKTETVAFFWAQIRKHPSSEGLYERFLSWLGSAELVNEQLKAYNSAIRRFDSGPWYQRLARWYIRQKRGRELGRYSHQLIDIFNEEEITDYLLGLEASGAKAAGDDVDWDQQLSFDLYSYARTHFPRNLFFVRGMLKYYEEHDRARWEKLSAQYYFAARSIREPYLAWLSKQGQLRDKYAEATRRVSVAAGIKTSSAPPATDSV